MTRKPQVPDGYTVHAIAKIDGADGTLWELRRADGSIATVSGFVARIEEKAANDWKRVAR
jgi:hypothetical protein